MEGHNNYHLFAFMILSLVGSFAALPRYVLLRLIISRIISGWRPLITQSGFLNQPANRITGKKCSLFSKARVVAGRVWF